MEKGKIFDPRGLQNRVSGIRKCPPVAIHQTCVLMVIVKKTRHQRNTFAAPAVMPSLFKNIYIMSDNRDFMKWFEDFIEHSRELGYRGGFHVSDYIESWQSGLSANEAADKFVSGTTCESPAGPFDAALNHAKRTNP